MSESNKVPLMHSPRKLTKLHQVLHTTMPPCMRTGRPTRHVVPATDPEALPRQKLTTPHTTTASHAIAAYVSLIVVGSITEAVILSYLYRDRLLLLIAKLMLRCSACHNLYMLRTFRQPRASKSY
jgi:hypothetical protein